MHDTLERDSGDLIDAQLRQIEQQRKLSQLSASLYYAYVEGLK